MLGSKEHLKEIYALKILIWWVKIYVIIGFL